MNHTSTFSTLVLVWITCAVFAAALQFSTAVDLSFFSIFTALASFGTAIAWIAQSVQQGARSNEPAPDPIVILEQHVLQPLMDFAQFHDGIYESIGRAGKATIIDSGIEIVIAGRPSPTGVLLIVSTRNLESGFRLELSPEQIRRTDVQQFKLGDAEFDSTFFVASTDVQLARDALVHCCEPLLSFGHRVAISTVRGNLEFKRRVPILDYDNAFETFYAFKTLCHALATSPAAITYTS